MKVSEFKSKLQEQARTLDAEDTVDIHICIMDKAEGETQVRYFSVGDVVTANLTRKGRTVVIIGL